MTARERPRDRARAGGRTGSGGAVPIAGLAPTSRASMVRRRLAAIAILVAFAFLATAAVTTIGADADPVERVAGHVVIEPGSSLWQVAVESAPRGVDPRAQLDAIRALNGIEGSTVDAWQVVLLPAR